jgi:hypothetical protein
MDCDASTDVSHTPLSSSAIARAAAPRLVVTSACLLTVACASIPLAGGVTLNGVPLNNVESRPDVTVGVTEYRDGGSDIVRVLPGSKRYAVSLVARDAIPVLEAQLPLSATPARFTVVTENGRTFRNCLVAALSSVDRGLAHRLVYTLRCEDVSP